MTSILGSQKIMPFVAITNPDQAKEFYRDKLGLTLVEEQLPFALVFDANGVTLRASLVKEVKAAGYTVLGWEVADISEVAKALLGAGVNLERYPGLGQDELGVWTAPGGAKVAWFKDPDGNILSISQH
jgi:catechol 2,3-dioxygenase-like lactoylglutathione lyase family enzyme